MPKSELAKKRNGGAGAGEVALQQQQQQQNPNQKSGGGAGATGSNKENDAEDVGDGIPWKCNICSKDNDGKTSTKCAVCGRPKKSAPLKMAGFMKLKVGSKAAREYDAKRSKNPNGSGLFASSSSSGKTGRSQRLDAAAMRVTMGGRSLPVGSGRNAVRQRQKKTMKKDSRPPSKWGGRSGSGVVGNHMRRAVGSAAPVDSLGAL